MRLMFEDRSQTMKQWELSPLHSLPLDSPPPSVAYLGCKFRIRTQGAGKRRVWISWGTCRVSVRARKGREKEVEGEGNRGRGKWRKKEVEREANNWDLVG